MQRADSLTKAVNFDILKWYCTVFGDGMVSANLWEGVSDQCQISRFELVMNLWFTSLNDDVSL
jgi:hypothetical protein